jgi:hypothetical protein
MEVSESSASIAAEATPAIESDAHRDSSQDENRLLKNGDQSGTTREAIMPLEGGDLVKTLLSSTGLPESEVGVELERILDAAGANPSTLTLEQLRAAMLVYLESTLGEAAELPSAEN